MRFGVFGVRFGVGWCLRFWGEKRYTGPLWPGVRFEARRNRRSEPRRRPEANRTEREAWSEGELRGLQGRECRSFRRGEFLFFVGKVFVVEKVKNDFFGIFGVLGFVFFGVLSVNKLF